MFKLTPNPTFSSEVRLTIPGEAEPGRITVTWRHKTRADYLAWRNQPAEDPTAGGARIDAAFLGKVIAGWDGPVDGPDDKPVPYSQEALALLLDTFPGAALDLLMAYEKALLESRAKN
jgi:hypothetical protein